MLFLRYWESNNNCRIRKTVEVVAAYLNAVNYFLKAKKKKYKTQYFAQPYLLRGLSPQGNYTDRATAACRRS
jgi:hypothetical protein